MLVNEQNYGIYTELIEKGVITVDLHGFNNGQIIDQHFNNIMNILCDGIEMEEVHGMMVHVIFVDGVELDLTIFDYLFNLMFWSLVAEVGEPIDSMKLFWAENITKGEIKKYIDNVFVRRYRTRIDFKTLNNTIDKVFVYFKALKNFQMYLSNTVNMEDTLDLMNQFKEFADTIHVDLSDVPFENVKDRGLEIANKQIEYIKNSDHCLADSFRAGEGISPKQFKEVNVSIGPKPSGFGEAYPYVINKSFINGGLDTPESMIIESAVGRIAQILQKTNVGTSGAFARILGLNNKDTRLHPDPNYSCETKNFEEVTIKNSTILKMYDMRYYRENPKGIDKLLDGTKDTHLIGRKLYFRSPMTCASYSHGKGICYKCYGDLAYVNRDINAGKIAAELLSSIYTQLLLSAKHLLESVVIKLEWNEEFYDIFDVNFNTIQLKEDISYKGFKLIINPGEIDVEEEFDELDYNEYVSSFKIKYPNNDIVSFHTAQSDSIYIHPDLLKKINMDEETVELDLEQLAKFPILFITSIANKDISRTMDMVKKIINNKATTKSFDRNSILEAFIDTNIEGNIILNSIHFEVILANQIRNATNIVDTPYWEHEGEDCNILTLNEALINNPSITNRLEYSKISQTLRTPSSFKIRKASDYDLYFVEKPQEFLSSEGIITDDPNLIINDVEPSTRNAIRFFEDDEEIEIDN